MKMSNVGYAVITAVLLVCTSHVHCCKDYNSKEALANWSEKDNEEKRHPSCQLEKATQYLWCDRTKFQTFSDIRCQGKVIPQKVKAIFLNDSLLSMLEEGDLDQYPEISIFTAQKCMLTKLKSRVFYSNRQLEDIDLSRNKIEEIEDDAFKDLVRLLRLNLGFNKISKITRRAFRDLIHLEYLSLEQNAIQIIPKLSFNRLRNLRTLSLRNNWIKTLEIRSLVGLPFLEKFDASGNEITSFNGDLFEHSPKLQILNLRNNSIKIIPGDIGEYVQDLRSLNLGENDISELTNSSFKSLHNLTFLYIDGNYIQNIEIGAFVDNANLMVLNLSSNKLDQMDSQTFFHNKNLRTLLLSSNELKHAKIEWFKYIFQNHSGKVDLSFNPWWCDCQVYELQQHIRHVNALLDITCNNQNYDGKVLSDVILDCPEQRSDNSGSSSLIPKLSKSASKIPTTIVSTIKSEPVTATIYSAHRTETPYKVVSTTTRSHETPKELATEHRSSNNNEKYSQEPILLAVYQTVSKVPKETSNTTIFLIVGIAVVVIAVVAAVTIYKKHKRECKRRTPNQPRRRRNTSAQPFLEDLASQNFDELPEPFSGSEEDIHELTTHPGSRDPEPDELFYTPRGTPKQSRPVPTSITDVSQA